MLRFGVLVSILFAAAQLPAQQLNQLDSPCYGVVATENLASCLSKAKASSEAVMQAQYEAIKKHLDEGERDQLAQSQELWLQYRDANCSAEKTLYGSGTGAQPAYLACMEAMTRQRTKDLKITYEVRLKQTN